MLINRERNHLFMSLRAAGFTDVPAAEKVVGNLWSDRDRIAAALGITKEELLPKMIESISNPVKPKVVEDPAFRQVEMDTFDLRKLPIPKFYPKDADGTSPLVLPFPSSREKRMSHSTG